MLCDPLSATLAGHMITPERFTAEELRQYSHPLTWKRRQEKNKIDAWLARGGGIHGEARGIHSNHLLPYERVERAFAEVSGLSALPARHQETVAHPRG